MDGFNSLDNPAKSSDIQDCITKLLQEWGMEEHPESVNHGKCFELADTVLHQVDGSLYRLSTSDIPSAYHTENEPGMEPEPYHVWLYDGDRHYDGEKPGGVRDWKELPFFQRALGL